MMYTAAEIKKMLRNRGQRSKLSWNDLPENYRLMRARNAVIGKKGAKAPQSYRDRLIQEMQANPGRRALLPDKYLTPEQRKMRANNTYLNSELFPGSGMRGRDLETQVRRGIQLQYGDQDQADANAVAQAQANRVRNSQWWDQYQQAVQNAQASFNQYAQAQQAPQISTSAPTVNGQVASPTAPAASGVQAALGSLAAGRANANQMASAAALASGVNTAGQRVGEQRSLMDQAVMNAIGQQRQTSRRKAMSAEDLRAKLISEAQQRFLENAGILTKQQQLEQAQALAQMRDRTTRRGQDISSDTTRRGQDISSADRRRGQDKGGTKGGGKSGSGGNSKPMNNNQINTFWTRVTKARAYLASKDENGKPRRGAAGRLAMENKYGADVTRIAYSLVVNSGGISRRDYNDLLNMGIPKRRIRYKVVKP